MLRGRVHFHYIYLYQFFRFIIGSFVLISIPFQALVSHICIAWSLMKIYLILYVNSFKVQHQPFIKIRLKKDELHISCEDGTELIV